MKKNWIMIAILAVLSCLTVKYSNQVFQVLALLVDALQPLLLGFAIAYILNILMKKLEKIYFPKRKDAWVERTRRPVCVFGSIFLVLFFILLLLTLIVPALSDAVWVLTKDIPAAFARFQKWLAAAATDAGFTEVTKFVNSLQIDWRDIYDKAGAFLTKGISSIFNSAFSVANVVVSFFVTGVIAVIFSIYMLFQKESLCRQIKKAALVYLPERWREGVEDFLKLAHDSFTSFISGQILEACILGSLCAAGMLILQLPYAVMIGAIVGVSALIPVMGAYIGAFVGAFMILTVSPVKALVFLVYLVILQQLEGNLIYPRVVGGSIGLPGIWVLAAVTVSGGLFGIPGMLIGVPMTATIYKWIRRDVQVRAKQKKPVRELHLLRELERFHEFEERQRAQQEAGESGKPKEAGRQKAAGSENPKEAGESGKSDS